MSAPGIYDLNSERALILQIAEGDERAFFVFYDHYSTLLRPFLMKYTRSVEDREEVVQETFIRVWVNRDQLSEIDNIRAWVYKIASRVYLNYAAQLINEKRRIGQLALTGAIEETDTPFEATHAREISESIRQAVSHMPEQKKRVFVMSRERGMKPAQIATELDMPVGTVKNQLSAALKDIREHLIGSGHGPVAIFYMLSKIF